MWIICHENHIEGIHETEENYSNSTAAEAS